MEWTSEIGAYIEEHSEQEPEVLAELRRRTHLQVMRPRMLSGNLQGQLLKMLCRLTRARRVLEIGTYTGYAAISMAGGMTEDGLVYTIDINDEIEELAREYMDRSGLADRIRFLTGDACELIPGLQETFDLVFIDADKRQYADYYGLVFDKVRPGGLIVADDILWEGKVVSEREKPDAQTRGILAFNELVAADKRVEKLILPLRHGLMLVRKKE